jgi:hypothetical protein
LPALARANPDDARMKERLFGFFESTEAEKYVPAMHQLGGSQSVMRTSRQLVTAPVKSFEGAGVPPEPVIEEA